LDNVLIFSYSNEPTVRIINNCSLEGDIMVRKPLFIRVEWDEDALIWVATSDDVPSLATEESNIERLIEKLKIMIPELLDANGIDREDEIPFEIITRRFETGPKTNLMTSGVKPCRI